MNTETPGEEDLDGSDIDSDEEGGEVSDKQQTSSANQNDESLADQQNTDTSPEELIQYFRHTDDGTDPARRGKRGPESRSDIDNFLQKRQNSAQSLL